MNINEFVKEVFGYTVKDGFLVEIKSGNGIIYCKVKNKFGNSVEMFRVLDIMTKAYSKCTLEGMSSKERNRKIKGLKDIGFTVDELSFIFQVSAKTIYRILKGI